MLPLSSRGTIALTLIAWVLAILVVPIFLPLSFPVFSFGGFIVHSDYLVHLAIFVLLVVSLRFSGVKIMKIGVIALVLIAAIVAEVWQIYIPKRTYNFSDLISNVAGVVLGYAIFLPSYINRHCA